MFYESVEYTIGTCDFCMAKYPKDVQFLQEERLGMLDKRCVKFCTYDCDTGRICIECLKEIISNYEI